MPSCLHVSSMFHLSDFLFFDKPSSHSFFFAKTLPLPPSQFHSWKTIMFFFFFWVKNSCRALHCHHAVAAPIFFFFFFFLFFWSKKTYIKKKKKLFLNLLSFTHGNNHGFFLSFFCLSKTLAKHYTVTVQWLLLSSSFLFFFFLSKKIPQKLSLPKRKFCLKLSRTLMWVQRLTECYGWSFNNGDLVLWVCNFFFLIKIALIWTTRIAHGSQNLAIGPRFVRVPAFFACSNFWC